MDAALSTPISTLKPTSSPFHPSLLLKKPSSYHHQSLPHLPFPDFSAAKPKPPPPTQSSLSFEATNPLLCFSSSPRRHQPLHRPSSSPPRVHRQASTGYAAALLDVARCHGDLADVRRDVRRFMRGVRPLLGNALLDDVKKGEVVKGVAEGGGFYKHLVALVKMLVGRRKVKLVAEVMEEFERIFDELSGTKEVLVASEVKMEEGELRMIATKVRNVSGAESVRVKHLFGV